MDTTEIVNNIKVQSVSTSRFELSALPQVTTAQLIQKLFLRVWIIFASVILMVGTLIFILFLHIFKIFRKIKLSDPFHDSRRHPLNDPHAPRG